MEITASADGRRSTSAATSPASTTQSRSRIAALDAQTGALLPFNPGANRGSTRSRSTATPSTSAATSRPSGTGPRPASSTRTRLAAADATTRRGAALGAHGRQAGLLDGVPPGHRPRHRRPGSSTRSTARRSWAWARSTARRARCSPWAANTVIQNHDGNAAIDSLTTDGEQDLRHRLGVLRRRRRPRTSKARSRPIRRRASSTGSTAVGATTTTSPSPATCSTRSATRTTGGCSTGTRSTTRTSTSGPMAIDKHRSPTLTNAFGTSDIWVFDGMPAAQPLHWLPTLTGGSYTGQGQAAWSVEVQRRLHGAGRRVPAGERHEPAGPRAVRQAGDLADGRPDPELLRARADGDAVGSGHRAHRLEGGVGPRQRAVDLRGAARRDDRDVDRAARRSRPSTNWWNRPPLGFVDATAPPGSSQTYRIRVTDPFGNSSRRPAGHGDHPGRHDRPPRRRTPRAVQADKPAWQWRLGEASGTTAYDRAGSNDQILNAANTRNISGALVNEADTATDFPGTSRHGAGARRVAVLAAGSADVLARGVGARRPRRPAARSSVSVTATRPGAARTAPTVTCT